MQRQLTILFLIGITMAAAKAQNASSFFISTPNAYIPQLEEAWRKDLVDLYQSGKEATLENTMGGRSTLKKVTSDYILLQTTERSSLEIKLLPLINDTYIACVVNTVYAPVADSRIEFFTMDWKPLASADLIKPADPEWFIKEGADRNNQEFIHATALLDIHLIKYQLNPEDLSLTATYTTPENLNNEDRTKVLPFLKDAPKTYQWKSGHFVD